MKGTQEKGITLIALVITIIVLLILAGVSISAISGKDGIIEKAKIAKERAEIANIKEEILLKIYNEQLNGNLSNSTLKAILEEYGTPIYEEGTLKGIKTEEGYEILYKDICADIYTETLEAVTYTATFSGTNVTSNGASKVKEKETYTATLTIESGYEIDTITVKMGGTELVENTGYTYAESIITIPNVSGNIEITVSAKIGGITASDIEADAIYIGEYVNYGGQETYKGVKWRIFNAENGQIQLIADNYIHKDVMPTSTNIKTNSNYRVYAGDNRITLLNYITTESNWSDFVAVTGAKVTGGPTLEQFKNSYNRTHGANSEATVKEIFIAKSEVMDDNLEGYYVGTSENPETFNMSGLNTTEMENLYVIDDDTNASGYWLGSPSAYRTYSVMRVGYNGDVNYLIYLTGNIALRPLVSLPSGITLVEQENGTYNIQ